MTNTTDFGVIFPPPNPNPVTSRTSSITPSITPSTRSSNSSSSPPEHKPLTVYNPPPPPPQAPLPLHTLIHLHSTRQNWYLPIPSPLQSHLHLPLTDAFTPSFRSLGSTLTYLTRSGSIKTASLPDGEETERVAGPREWLPLDDKGGRTIAARLYRTAEGEGTELRVFYPARQSPRQPWTPPGAAASSPRAPVEAGCKFPGRLYYADASPRLGLAVAVTDDVDLDRSTFYVYALRDVTGLDGSYPSSAPVQGATVSGRVRCLNVDDGGGTVLVGTEEGAVEQWTITGGAPRRTRSLDLGLGPVKSIITRRAGSRPSVDFGFFTEHRDGQERATLTRDNTDKLCYVTKEWRKDCEVRHGLQSHTADYQSGRLLVFGVRGWEERGEYKEESECKVYSVEGCSFDVCAVREGKMKDEVCGAKGLRGGVLQAPGRTGGGTAGPKVVCRRRLRTGLWRPRYNRFFTNVVSVGERWAVCNVGAKGVVLFDFEGLKDDDGKGGRGEALDYDGDGALDTSVEVEEEEEEDED